MISVLLRTDAGHEIGYGHLARSMNLADALATRGAKCVFVMRSSTPPDLAAAPARRGHALAFTETAPGTALLDERDAAAVLRSCADHDPAWIVIDHYGASATYLTTIARERRICVVDDVGGRDLTAASVVVNPAPEADRLGYRLGPRASLLAGPDYALLHPSFGEVRASSLARMSSRARAIARVVVIMGGSDATGSTGCILSALIEKLPAALIDVVLGPVAREDVTASPRIRVHAGLTPSEMAARMTEADLAIVTASTLALESSCLGVRSVFLQVADNQRFLAGALSDRGATVCAASGFSGALSAELGRSPEEALATMRLLSSLCDGDGARRVADHLLLGSAVA